MAKNSNTTIIDVKFDGNSNLIWKSTNSFTKIRKIQAVVEFFVIVKNYTKKIENLERMIIEKMELLFV